MARAGLGPNWHCIFANDFNRSKAGTYALNWGEELTCCDITSLSSAQLPEQADLAWASFPCQDLSLAGKTAGIGNSNTSGHTRSGTFWPFWRLIRQLSAEGRAPGIIALENVVGLLHANCGADFTALGVAIAEAGYNFGAVIIDAKHFVPQSRPRVFVVAVSAELPIPVDLIEPTSTPPAHSILARAKLRLPPSAQASWISWRLPAPPPLEVRLEDIIDTDPVDISWDSPAETALLISSMSPTQRCKVEAIQHSPERRVGTVFKRTRPTAGGSRVFAEARFDGLAGCIRPPGGGSSRQKVLVSENGLLRSRLIGPRELARLMGLPETYRLPEERNAAFQLLGDGVAVPAVRFLAEQILEPILAAKRLAQLGDVWSPKPACNTA